MSKVRDIIEKERGGLTTSDTAAGDRISLDVYSKLETDTKYLVPTGDGSQLTGIDALPSQSGHTGKYLGTDGSVAAWNVLDTDANTTTKFGYEHSNTVSVDYAIGVGNNMIVAGPLTIDATITIPDGSTMVIV